MSRLGSYSTFDCPTEKQDEALAFLQDEFKKIDGEVWLKNNPHDFGEYPSFEIDYPDELEDIDDDDLEEDDELLSQLDEWQDKANEIESKYNKKFKKYL